MALKLVFIYDIHFWILRKLSLFVYFNGSLIKCHLSFQELQFALQIFNYFFTSVFILEAIMKIVALGTIRYLKDR